MPSKIFMCNWRPTPFPWGINWQSQTATWGPCLVKPAERNVPGLDCFPWEPRSPLHRASTAWAGQKKTTFPAPSLVDWPFLAHIPGPQAGGSVLPVGRQVMRRERRDTLLQLSRSTKIHRGSRRCGADETENAQVVLMESFVGHPPGMWVWVWVGEEQLW